MAVYKAVAKKRWSLECKKNNFRNDNSWLLPIWGAHSSAICTHIASVVSRLTNRFLEIGSNIFIDFPIIFFGRMGIKLGWMPFFHMKVAQILPAWRFSSGKTCMITCVVGCIRIGFISCGHWLRRYCVCLLAPGLPLRVVQRLGEGEAIVFQSSHLRSEREWKLVSSETDLDRSGWEKDMSKSSWWAFCSASYSQ